MLPFLHLQPTSSIHSFTTFYPSASQGGQQSSVSFLWQLTYCFGRGLSMSLFPSPPLGIVASPELHLSLSFLHFGLLFPSLFDGRFVHGSSTCSFCALQCSIRLVDLSRHSILLLCCDIGAWGSNFKADGDVAATIGLGDLMGFCSIPLHCHELLQSSLMSRS